MNLQFLKTEWYGDREFAYMLDADAGVVYRAEVKDFRRTEPPTYRAPTSSVVVPVVRRDTDPTAASRELGRERGQDADAGDMETPEQRAARLASRGKVPLAFLGDIRRMGMDPAKFDGKTDVTPTS